MARQKGTRIEFIITDELVQAIDFARGDAARNPWIEAQLWRLKAVRAAAAELGLEKPVRAKPGRPKRT